MTKSMRIAALLAATTMCAVAATAGETVTYTYDALGRLIGASSNGTVNNGQAVSTSFDPAGNRTNYTVSGSQSSSPTISIAASTATEGGNLNFVVTRTGSTAAASTVNFATSNGTAVAPSDFTARSGTLTMPVGQASATMVVATIDDTAVESTEVMSVTLSAPSNGYVLGTASAAGTINDNDTAPANLAIGNASATEGGTLAFPVTRSGNTASAVSATFATAGGTATSGSDFNAASGTVSFAANQTSATINVATIDDTLVEPAEAMSVSLSAPSSGAAITSANGTGTINDNDTAGTPSIAISDASGTEAQNQVFTVTLSSASASTVTINYATAIGTAGALDFTAASGTLTFSPGQTSKTIAIATNSDFRSEANEIFYVNLTSPTNATIGDGQGVGTIFDDGLGGGGGCSTC